MVRSRTFYRLVKWMRWHYPPILTAQCHCLVTDLTLSYMPWSARVMPSMHTQVSKFKPWRSKAKHATSGHGCFPQNIFFTSGAALTTAPGPSLHQEGGGCLGVGWATCHPTINPFISLRLFPPSTRVTPTYNLWPMTYDIQPYEQKHFRQRKILKLQITYFTSLIIA